MRFTWSNEFATGIQTIDLQHQALFSTINALHDCYENGGTHEQLQPILLRLTHYILFHFRTEEGLMSQATLPPDWYAEHLAAHHEFTVKINDYADRLPQLTPAEVEDLLNYLVEWLKDHILVTDKSLASYLARSAPGGAFDDRR
ncbi:bacteriohemerythrin [Paludibacterium purpuratum]|uniref:Hemerythrin n=1 Tax=Paludibacterium purpuratum TaxID=1144873 RepID=A0A4R7B9K5_9NEIS|nr:bacteriohemerythrin [Paludibacterium purpuratum]TDR81508.1 hemerythrin [Paludibacterium purpuratum]